MLIVIMRCIGFKLHYLSEELKYNIGGNQASKPEDLNITSVIMLDY